MILHDTASLLHFDRLSIIMTILISYIAITVGSFSSRYLKGDARYSEFFMQLALLVLSTVLMVSANNLLIFIIAWFTSNSTLVSLMTHKSAWRAANASGIITRKIFLMGLLFIASGFYLLYRATGEMSIQAINSHPTDLPIMYSALLLMFVGAMTQSSIIPFHKWLLSSLNSPTPVSAVMHAGLVNGGGFLLMRFAPLYINTPSILTIIFSAGLLTALVGTLWKLVQSDVKRMLACSTISQMGFMLVQCGLGLFPAAVAHLCWHGLFKAYLFLSSASVVQEKRVSLGYPPRVIPFVISLLCGLVGSFSFAQVAFHEWIQNDSRVVIELVVFIACSQLSLTLLANSPFKRLPMTLIASSLMASLYGLSILWFEAIVEPMHFMRPQPLQLLHYIGMSLVVISWIGFIFAHQMTNKKSTPGWLTNLYVKVLNTSQPHQDTITAHRNHYEYR